MPATFVVTTPAHPGHLFPMLGLVETLTGAGHRVVVHAPASERAPVEAAGAELAPFTRHRDFFPTHVDRVLAPRTDGWTALRGPRRSARLLLEQYLTRVLPFAVPAHAGRELGESALVLARELAPILRDTCADCLLAN